MIEFKIEGNHPILRRIDWVSLGVDDLNRKVKELEDAGYEVTVKTVDPNAPQQS